MQILTIRNRAQLARGMHDRKIPRRHDVGFGIPHRRDVSMGPAKNNDTPLPAVEGPGLGILAGKVAADRAVAAGIAIEPYGDMGNTQFGRGGHQLNEREFVHEIVQESAVFHAVRFWNVKRFSGGLRSNWKAREREGGKESTTVHPIILPDRCRGQKNGDRERCRCPRIVRRAVPCKRPARPRVRSKS